MVFEAGEEGSGGPAWPLGARSPQAAIAHLSQTARIHVAHVGSPEQDVPEVTGSCEDRFVGEVDVDTVEWVFRVDSAFESRPRNERSAVKCICFD